MSGAFCLVSCFLHLNICSHICSDELLDGCHLLERNCVDPSLFWNSIFCLYQKSSVYYHALSDELTCFHLEFVRLPFEVIDHYCGAIKHCQLIHCLSQIKLPLSAAFKSCQSWFSNTFTWYSQVLFFIEIMSSSISQNLDPKVVQVIVELFGWIKNIINCIVD